MPQWLDTMKCKTPEWAACYTWQHWSYGVHSTQRAESVHGVINTFCSKKCTIPVIASTDLEQQMSEKKVHQEINTVKVQDQL
jgi:hypothetical protein